MKTLALAAIAALVTAVALRVGPDAVAALVADEPRLIRGELWRTLTGPLIHVTWGHLARDLALVVGVGLAYEAPLRHRWSVLLAAGLVVPTVMVLACTDVTSYYGLSGLSHALLAAAITHELRVQRGRARSLAGVVGLGLLAKVIVDALVGGMFPVDLGPGVVVAPLAHLVGVVVGALVVALPTRIAASASAPAPATAARPRTCRTPRTCPSPAPR